jgi:hypothetical protein
MDQSGDNYTYMLSMLDTYMVIVSAATGSTPLTVSVNPSTLTFTKVGEKTSYTMSCSRLDIRNKLVRSVRIMQIPPCNFQFNHGDVDPAGQ